MKSGVEAALWPRASGPSDLPEIEAIPLESRGLPASSYELVVRAASLWPDREAVSVLPDAEHWESPVTLTFSELASDVHRVANVFSELGVGRGEAVSVVALNCLQLLAVLLAAEAVGVYAPINPGLAIEDASRLVKLSRSKVIVAPGPELDPEIWERSRAIASEAGSTALLALRPTAARRPAPALEPLDGTRVCYLEDLLAEADADSLPVEPPVAEDVASLLHTGGTTGTPKLAVRTHANEVSNAWMVACNDEIVDDGTIFAALPLFHTNALIVTVLAPLLRGQHVLWAGPLGYRDLPLYGCFWKLVRAYGVAAMSGVPTVYAVLAQVPVDADISSLRFPVVGAAPLPPAVTEAWESHTGIPLCEGYGLTEATCVTSRNWPSEIRRGSVGQRLPYQEVAAADIDQESGEWKFLPPGEIGTIVVRGPNVFAGYLIAGENGVEASADGKVFGGWLNTGDLGSVDDEGYIRLAGRAKDLIIRGGHNIDPTPIEDALLEHSEVIAAAAVGRPDLHSGEVPVAYVSLAPGAAATDSDLLAWAAERVPEAAAAPKNVEIVDEIPLTAVGKPFKPELRRRATQDAARAALSGLTVAAAAEAVLKDGTVEIRVPHSTDDEAVRSALEMFAWEWVFV